MKVTLLSVIILSACLTGGAVDRLTLSTPEPRRPTDSCPTVTVSCPTECVGFGEEFQVFGSVSGGYPNQKINYQWKVSAGKIVSGQGTSVITIENHDEGYATTTLTVGEETVGPECNKTASCTLIICDRPMAHKFDSYGALKRATEVQRLDQFVIELKNSPSAQGYVIGYGQAGGYPTKITARLRRIEEYLIGKRGIDGGRIVSIDGGTRDQFTVELWIVPSGANPPVAEPKR